MANILETEKKIMAVSMLCEGNSIRSIERITGVHRDTIMRLGLHRREAQERQPRRGLWRRFDVYRAGRMANRIQVSTDSLKAYPDAIERVFGTEVGHGQIVKTYSCSILGNAAVRYSPVEIVKVERTIVSGMPDVNRITTSHVESQNLTLRMHCRRLTRLTNAYSKKFENFQAAVALNFAYYNFCKTHNSLRMTPAQAAGVEKSAWTVAELIERCGE